MAVFSWQRNINNLPDAWCKARGAGVRIAILDSGMDFSHPGLAHLDIAGRKFDFQKPSPTGVDDVQDMRPNGEPHGTYLASILSGKAVGTGGVWGVAPDSDLFFFRIADAHSNTSLSTYLKAVKKAVELDIDIIVAAVWPDSDNSITATALQDVLDSLKTKKIALFAPTNNTNHLDSLNSLKFPSDRPEAFTIGRITSRIVEAMGTNGRINSQINLLVPKLPVRICADPDQGDSPEKDMGSSFGVATVAGILALLLSDKRKSTDAQFRFTKQELQEVLQPICKQLSLDELASAQMVCLFQNV